MGSLEARSAVHHAHVYTMRELNHRTAEIIKEINEDGQPAVITRHGRFVALITPLASENVEAAVLGAVLDAAENSRQLTGERTVGALHRLGAVAEELDVHGVGPDVERDLG